MSAELERARFNMIEQQVRPWDVLDARVLAALAKVHREDFVLPRVRKLAFADTELPINDTQVMMKPVVEGRLLQALLVAPTDNVLEIGTGSGFVTACLCELGREVTSVEIDAALASKARGRLTSAGYSNVSIRVADALANFVPQQTFDAIAVTAAVFTVPSAWREWLSPGGRLFVIRGESPVMEALLVTRDAYGHGFAGESLFETDLPYLIGGAPPPRFEL